MDGSSSSSDQLLALNFGMQVAFVFRKPSNCVVLPFFVFFVYKLLVLMTRISSGKGSFLAGKGSFLANPRIPQVV